MTVSDIQYLTYGSAINILSAYIRNKKAQMGQGVVDDEARYNHLKKIEPEIDRLYKNGEINQDKYNSYKQSLRRWEDG